MYYLDPTTHIDNEYSRAGTLDPKIVVTTSRDPSSKLLQFAKVRRCVDCAYCDSDSLEGNALGLS